jgi:hypothetical protein
VRHLKCARVGPKLAGTCITRLDIYIALTSPFFDP